ncbi:MAG: [Ruminococcus sp.]|uniref:[FeFe] hydrogenase H-cluster maturation GTPase HydF n=1 Tax=Ruminococcus sp. TaxID=41978 RepID=UPI0028738B0D|nr:[FeFe] hydrogenase H-cluster maturation GTPase HydF [Ruminococcus sp.]MBQ3285812.1 [FeFe] hydrogenase H-cluster maturation GTPase HydF [Ruminococcus sp.]
MSLNTTVSALRPHIAFFGRRNAGKSSVVNAVTNQRISVVSETLGTTTDPVKKAMELLPLGPVVIIDTPGFDDEGALGELRVERTREVLRKTDIAVLVVDGTVGLADADEKLIDEFVSRKLPYLVVYNKSDIMRAKPHLNDHELLISALTGEGIGELKERLAHIINTEDKEKFIVADLVDEGDIVVLVIPIDESAPKGRIILPQQQTLRELLDHHCTVVCCQDTELKATLSKLSDKPALVITDSQAFKRVSADVPADVPLTSFSILFARYKGDLDSLIRGANMLKNLRNGDQVLISEGCTHHRQCGDIGTVKLPAWIREYSGAEPEFSFTSGGTFPDNLSAFKVIVHCGGCMLNEKEMRYRQNTAKAEGVPMVNYGIAIAAMNGILDRALQIVK